jgi:hypothetical protein
MRISDAVEAMPEQVQGLMVHHLASAAPMTIPVPIPTAALAATAADTGDICIGCVPWPA